MSKTLSDYVHFVPSTYLLYSPLRQKMPLAQPKLWQLRQLHSWYSQQRSGRNWQRELHCLRRGDKLMQRSPRAQKQWHMNT